MHNNYNIHYVEDLSESSDEISILQEKIMSLSMQSLQWQQEKEEIQS